jgi:hypothetical protein
LEHCDKHNLDYDLYLYECPVCYGEKIGPAVHDRYKPKSKGFTKVPDKVQRRINEHNK